MIKKEGASILAKKQTVGWPTNLGSFIAERSTPEGQIRIQERLNRSIEIYNRTVVNEQRPQNRPDFRIGPAKAHVRITQS